MDKLQIFSLKPHTVQLDNGNSVCVRRLTAAERIQWFEYLEHKTKDKSGEELSSLAFALEDSVRLLALGLSDDKGNRLFSDGELSTIKAIDCVTVDRLANEILNLNGMGSTSAEDAKKKSETIGSITTSSPNLPAVSA